MAAKTIEEITCTFVEDGKVVRRELEKRVLKKTGVWVTVFYLFSDWSDYRKSFQPPKVMLTRYRFVNGEYKRKKSINMAVSQLAEGMPTLQEWIDAVEAGEYVGALEGAPCPVEETAVEPEENLEEEPERGDIP